MATTRTHATQLAYDIADRMRANVAGSYTTDIDNAVTAILNGYALASCPYTLPGTPVQADNDLDTWCTAVGNILPSGDAKITQARQKGLDDTLNTLDDVVTYDVTVYWNEARIAGVNGKGCGPDLNVDLRCMQLNVTIPRPIANE